MINTSFPLLYSINSPADLKKLPKYTLDSLSDEIRRFIVQKVSKSGGHLSSNLGTVDLTIALHRVFDSPTDKIIWDVGHQSYTHKILTGRRDKFDTLRMKNGISGFPKRSESVHDIVDTGHSSTSISAGLGIVAGQRLRHETGKVIAVIGDGALTGGMAFEGLNNAGHLGKNMIIVLNDNKMSISQNVGALSSYLSRLTATPYYQKFRETVDHAVEHIPRYGARLMKLIIRLKKGVKAVFFKENIFSELGFEYVGPIDGHNIDLLIRVFEVVRNIERPIVVHVVTRKGKGYPNAEDDPSSYHGVTPFSLIDGKLEKKGILTYTEAFSGILLKAFERDPSIVAISAAMCKGTGLTQIQAQYPERVFDVGITEQHAVTFAAGLAVSGLKPVVAIYSTFMQRAVDQVIHDVAIPELPVVFAMDRSGLVGGDGETHQGVYDIPLFKSVPNLQLMAPANSREISLMMDYALFSGKPSMIRYAKEECGPDLEQFSAPIVPGRGVFSHRSGEDVLLIAVGSIFSEVHEAGNILSRNGIQTDTYNLRFIKPLDSEYLLEIACGYGMIFLYEDGAESGGIGETIGALFNKNGIGAAFHARGVPDRFHSQATRMELLAECGLDRNSIADHVRSVMNGTSGRERKIVRFTPIDDREGTSVSAVNMHVKNKTPGQVGKKRSLP